ALADDRGDDRDGERRERPEAGRDRLRLPALLRADPRIGALRVDEGEDWSPEALRELEEPDRLPVAFRTRHAEVPGDALAGRPPAGAAGGTGAPARNSSTAAPIAAPSCSG